VHGAEQNLGELRARLGERDAPVAFPRDFAAVFGKTRTSMTRRLSLMLLACACQSGSTVDVQLVATPTTTLSTVTLDLDTTGVVHHDELVLDGGAALPASLRVLADGDKLTATAKGFDVDGGFRTNTASLALVSGKTQTLQLDLSNQLWCPAGPLLPNEIVLYGKEDGSDVNVFGYNAPPFSEPNDPSLACSGNICAQYVAMHEYDGLGLQFPTRTRYKHVSFRFWASESSQWSFFFALGGNPTTAFVFPDPSFCTNNQQACASTIGPVWQRIEFDVPASIPDTDGLQMQLVSVPNGPVTARFDDVRVIP
jgi:hypothetical protein